MRFFTRIPLLLVCCALLSGGPAFSQQTVTVDQIIQQHDMYERKIRSLASSFDVEYSVKRPSAWNTIRANALFIDAGAGRQAYERGMNNKNSQNVLTVNDTKKVYSFGGSYIDLNTRSLRFRKGERVAVAVYDEHHTDPMVMPLNYGYKIYDVWFADFLRETKMAVGPITTDPEYGTLYQLSGTNLQGQNIKI